ncbi:MAG: nicotinate (nicotinamide) nucleotide adenylyltransferase [Chlamydiae bacterium RIFCSPHIGHO2_12_FULL_49_9]|nr:MAG: nicotinate (nicotinamide) nucleotide adenylyltransferase [Chlamydiae bacterium RIFCSPHIGHO2_12_FULL_49_9]
MKKVGFFGGSFDPIHFGHINLALELLEKRHLDEALFCPAFCSPFKGDHPPSLSKLERLELLKLALEGVPHARISTLELDREGPSYTVDTIRELLKLEKSSFRLLLSEEAAERIMEWREAQELVRLAPPLVGVRDPSSSSKGPFERVRTRVFEVSSTEIRERLKRGLYCGHLIPPKALDYILQNGLYSR